MFDLVQTPLTIGSLIISAGLVAWNLAKGAWLQTIPGIIATGLGTLSLVVLLNSHPDAGPLHQDPVEGCDYAKFPICQPFISFYRQNAWFLGDAIGPAVQIDGKLTQPYQRGALAFYPENPPAFQVQELLLGQQFLQQTLHEEAQATREIAVPPVLSRWSADKSRSSDLLQILGNLLTVREVDGREQAVFQRGVLSWPAGTTDLQDVRIEPTGEWIFPRIGRAPAPWWTELWVRLGLVACAWAGTFFSAIQTVRQRGNLDYTPGGF